MVILPENVHQTEWIEDQTTMVGGIIMHPEATTMDQDVITANNQDIWPETALEK